MPILALVCALAKGESRILGAARLRLKESDRLSATCQELNRLGGRVQETRDGLIIQVGAEPGGRRHLLTATAITASPCCWRWPPCAPAGR